MSYSKSILVALLSIASLGSVAQAANRSMLPIVGGSQIKDQSQVPFLVQLYARGVGVECGGTVIAPTWILTAGHCSEVIDKVTIQGGTLVAGSGTKLAIKNHYLHPQFSETNEGVSYDFMLIELAQPIDFAKTKIQSIALADGKFASSGLQDPGQMMTVAGWGDLKENGYSYPKNAYSVEVPIVSNQDANASDSYNGAIDDSSIAAGYPNGGKDSCDGDSGGPLYVFDKAQNKNVLVGVVSFGEGCARAKKYGIYGRVSAAYDWIQKTINGSQN